jgi:hypothetical protein
VDPRGELLAGLMEQLKLEKAAKDAYQELVNSDVDARISAGVGGVLADEVSHIRIVEGLIELVAGYGKPLEKADAAPVDNADVFFRGANAILLLSGLDRYVADIIKALRRVRGRRVVYVSFNKVPKYTKRVLSDHDIDVGAIRFIDCVDSSVPCDVSVPPNDLTRLSIAVSEALEGIGADAVIIFDTLSGLSTFHDVNTISRFVGILNNNARTKGHAILWVAVDSPDEGAVNSRASQLCDRTLRGL